MTIQKKRCKASVINNRLKKQRKCRRYAFESDEYCFQHVDLKLKDQTAQQLTGSSETIVEVPVQQLTTSDFTSLQTSPSNHESSTSSTAADAPTSTSSTVTDMTSTESTGTTITEPLQTQEGSSVTPSSPKSVVELV